jgi:hypothetical protein
MRSRERLLVRVDDDLVLDAGESEHVEGPDGLARVVHPPRTALFHQVFDYLAGKTGARDASFRQRRRKGRRRRRGDPESHGLYS